MSSVLDLLINEVANVLGITPAEVKRKFTSAELSDLLNSSLCEPLGETNILFDTTEAPCDDLAVPNLLPPIDIAGINIPTGDAQRGVQKCIDNVEETNKIIEKQIDLYNQHKILLDKLLEYRDNYAPISYYFDERAKEVARILGIFEPLLIELRRLQDRDAKLNTDLSQITELIFVLADAYAESLLDADKALYDQAVSTSDIIEKSIETNLSNIDIQEETLKTTSNSFAIFSNEYYIALSGYLTEDNYDNTSFVTYIGNLFDNFITHSDVANINTQFEAYSSCITTNFIAGKPTSIKQAIEQTYFKFDINFTNLHSIRTQREKFNKKTGDPYTETQDQLIQASPLLVKHSFFQDAPYFSLRQFEISGDVLPTGRIYTQYYNLFKDPINNFFSIEERGLTSNVNLVDPKLRGTGSEKKREGEAEYYIQNIDSVQNFYTEFDARFEKRKLERHAQVIEPAQNIIRLTMQTIARKEIQLLLAVGRVNKYLPGESTALTSALDTVNRQNAEFLQGLADLDSEISRITQKLDALKPTPQKIKNLLKETSPECFDTPVEDDPNADCGGAKAMLGTDPFFVNSINGCDPTLPNQNQICYWVEFAKIATLVGLLPLPNIPEFTKLRYWPVGLTIPYPGGLVKIPLPIMWIPLVAISTPLGNIVIFLTVNGIFISPVVFLVSSSGFKQHILTVKGPSKKFGYTGEDTSIKPGIQVPASLLAIKAKAARLAQEASLGVNHMLSAKEKLQLQQQKNILGAAESAANKNGNAIRKLKVAREKKNLASATEHLSDAEKLAKIVDKVDSVKDIIEDAKRAILNRIDDLGKPALGKSNSIKNKITTRQDKLLADLKKALVDGDDSKAARIRGELSTDGISLSDKRDAIKSDLMAYFDRIKFPKITLPKDSSTVDPKLNAIVEFLSHINEFSSIYKTQFFSKDDSKVQKLLAIQLAKSKDKIKTAVNKSLSQDETIDLNNEPDKARNILKDITKVVTDAVSGKSTSTTADSAKKKVDAAKEKVKTEKDPAKRAKLRKDLEKAQVGLSDAFENERVKQALALTPAVIATLSQISIDFNPFSPCCKKKEFKLALGISPAVPIFNSAKSLMNSYINGMSVQDLKVLFGGKPKISARDISTAYLSLIKKSIPANLEIPLPDINLLTLAKSFSGILSSLFEIKAPNLGAQPALPLNLTVDLNLLKKPLANLLLTYLENSLPDPFRSAAKPAASTPQVLSGKIKAGAKAVISNTSILDKNISIINCEPNTSQKSAISGGIYSPKSSSPTTTSSAFSSGNVIVNTKKDILPNFQTLDLDFLNINPGDLLAVLKNFVDLKFDEVEKLLEPFYNILKIAKGLKGTNLNLLESIQFKLPPYGPAAEGIHIAITNLKKQIPKSATLQIIDTESVSAGAKVLAQALGPIANSPLPALLIAGAGAVDSMLPSLKIPKVDTASGAISTQDVRAATFALRSLHPLLVQDDLPPWERLTMKNILFLLFVDEFISNAADKLGFFRSFI